MDIVVSANFRYFRDVVLGGPSERVPTLDARRGSFSIRSSSFRGINARGLTDGLKQLPELPTETFPNPIRNASTLRGPRQGRGAATSVSARPADGGHLLVISTDRCTYRRTAICIYRRWEARVDNSLVNWYLVEYVREFNERQLPRTGRRPIRMEEGEGGGGRGDKRYYREGH